MTTELFRSSVSTPLGEMCGLADEHGIVLCDFVDSPHFEREMNGVNRYLPNGRIVDRRHPHLTRLEEELSEYFAGRRQRFDLPLHPLGTPFQLSVWRILQTIPYGTTCTYADQARMLGRPTAVRAVASANGRNRLPILIPCHRVVGSDGSLTGYSSGIDRKAELLRLEQRFRF
ncbi:MAG: methylated-DNA--[protein]-cysteine S-methyltransferase [Rikenella sp.]|nr:methylated-DNA--[protein]-cysteine S-methyltransferase [Rikenella sp.]